MKAQLKFPLSLLVMVIMGAFLIISCDNKPPEHSKAAQAMRGKEIFKKQCTTCHGGAGMEANASVLAGLEKKPLDLTRINDRRGVKDFPVSEIARIIDGRNMVQAHGPRDMPVWGEIYEAEGLDSEQIRGRKGELVAYLMSIQKYD